MFLKRLFTLTLFLSLSFNISAAEFSVDKMGYRLGEVFTIDIEGKITHGDYDKFVFSLKEAYRLADEAFKRRLIELKKNGQYAAWMEKNNSPSGMATIEVHLNSRGGSVTEAIKIGYLARTLLLKTKLGGVLKHWDEPQCLSSCFFIWSAGVEREYVPFGDPIYLGVHRLRFNSDYFKKLLPKEAENKYRTLVKVTKDFFEDMNIPDYYTTKVFNTPSSSIDLLTEREAKELAGTAPFLDELLAARCGSYTREEKGEYLDCGLTDGFHSTGRCKVSSAGYLSYLKQKIETTEECKFNNLAIARWESAKKNLFNK